LGGENGILEKRRGINLIKREKSARKGYEHRIPLLSKTRSPKPKQIVQTEVEKGNPAVEMRGDQGAPSEMLLN